MNDEEIKKEFEEIKRRLDTLERKNKIDITSDNSSKKKSIKEFFIEKNPSKDYEKTLVIGYYLENYFGLKSFKVKDLEEGYKSAKEKAPGNINYKIVQNIQKGYMMEVKEVDGKLKAWSLTNTGEKVIEEGFNKNGN